MIKKEQMIKLREKAITILKNSNSWIGIGADIPEELENIGFHEIFSKWGYKEYRYKDSSLYIVIDYSNKLYLRIKNHITLKGYTIF